MGTLAVLVIALGLVGFVLYWSNRHGDRRRNSGTSLRRGPNAHTTTRGQAKKAYATREEALQHASRLGARDGAAMSVYQCPTCAKWHVGHAR